MAKLIVTNDNFVWVDVTDKAYELFEAGIELYAVDLDKGNEALIENKESVSAAKGFGYRICIEGGHLKPQFNLGKTAIIDGFVYAKLSDLKISLLTINK